jgi:hypothetical protein
VSHLELFRLNPTQNPNPTRGIPKCEQVLNKFDDNKDSVVDRDELERGFAETGIDIDPAVFNNVS